MNRRCFSCSRYGWWLPMWDAVALSRSLSCDALRREKGKSVQACKAREEGAGGSGRRYGTCLTPLHGALDCAKIQQNTVLMTLASPTYVGPVTFFLHGSTFSLDNIFFLPPIRSFQRHPNFLTFCQQTEQTGITTRPPETRIDTSGTYCPSLRSTCDRRTSLNLFFGFNPLWRPTFTSRSRMSSPASRGPWPRSTARLWSARCTARDPA